MSRHPRKIELMAYAESLAGKGGALSVKTGAHISSCPQCQAELEGLRGSLEFIHSAPELEPTAEFTSQLLMAAQSERRLLDQRRGRQAFMAAVKGLSYAAGILIVGAICFGAGLSGSTGESAVHTALEHPAGVSSEPVESSEMLRRAAAEIKTLAAAVNFQSKNPATPLELEYRRAVQALAADIEAARAALELNPGCARATSLINSHLQRQVQALRTLYVERSL